MASRATTTTTTATMTTTTVLRQVGGARAVLRAGRRARASVDADVAEGRWNAMHRARRAIGGSSDAAWGAEATMDALEPTHVRGLNDYQREAVLAPTGATRVLAGPGSGKTHVLIGRVAHLIHELKTPPSEILCITFTNKAARELRERLRDKIGDAAARDITAGTFHSVAARMLRRHGEWIPGIGRTGDFTIYDADDSKHIVRDVLVNKFGETKKTAQPGPLRNWISTSKSCVKHSVGLNGSHMLRALLDAHKPIPPMSHERFVECYDEYEMALRQANAFDFDDLLSATVAMLELCPDARAYYERRWSQVLVDEFQDTSTTQYELIRQLSQPQGSVFVVGDADQAIYGWRGAEVANIRTQFDEDFTDVQTYMLTTNYRSTATIVEAAQAVIKESSFPSPLDLVANTPGGRDVAIVEASDDREEAEFIAMEVRKMVKADSDLRYSDVAVLYRTNSQARVLEEAFIRAGVPHTVIGDTSFYGRKEIKDLIAYLRVVLNPSDTVSLDRVINTPTRGIGNSTIEKIKSWIETLPTNDGVPPSLGDALFGRAWMTEPDENAELLPSAEDMGLSSRARTAVMKFAQLMAEAQAIAVNATPGELLEEIIRNTGYDTVVQDADDGSERWAFVQELIHLAKEPPQNVDEAIPDRVGLEALGAFLEGISLLTSAESKEEEGGDTTKLMTMHASKGLEFNSVFIAGVEDGLIPFVRDGNGDDDQDEEVRLFYVGITRAKRKLMLCHARERRRFGQNPQPAKRSFLLDSISAMLTGSKKPERSVSMPRSSTTRGASRSSRGKVDWGARVAVDLPPPTRKREGSRQDRIDKSRELISKVTGTQSSLPLPLRKAKQLSEKGDGSKNTTKSERAKPRRTVRRRKPSSEEENA